MADSYKTRVWKGRQQAYIQNPNTGKYGWYNIEDRYMTDYGREVQASITALDEDDNYYSYSSDSFDDDHYFKWEADTKEARLRRNIMYVLDTKIGEQHSIIKDVDYLHQKIFNILDDMSDFQLINFSREYKKELQLFFDYKTYINNDYSELDARTLKLLDGLGINAEIFMEINEVPSEVRQKLSVLNERLSLEGIKFGDE